MAANKIVHEPGKYFDCTSMHGKWCTITMVGQDVGYARVGIISSGRDYILFQFRDKTGLVAKAYVKHIVEVKMNERKLKKEQELVYESIDLTDFREKTKPYFKMVMNQVMLLIIFAVAAFYKKEQTEDEIVKEFKNQLTMLRYGACEISEKK